MSNSFNMHRILQLARWSIRNDRPYHRKTFASTCAVMTIIFQIPNLQSLLHAQSVPTNGMPMAASLATFITVLVVGGSYMFYSFSDRRDGFRDLLLIPASNLEKFLVRYLGCFLLMLLITISANLIADALQYLIGILIQRENVGSVVYDCWCFFKGQMADVDIHSVIIEGKVINYPPLGILLLFLWIHSLYMLGANFFRYFKYSWVFTTIILVALLLVFSYLTPSSYHFGRMLHQALDNTFIRCLLLVLSVANVLLSYRLFCKNQLIGKYFNWI